MVLFPSPRGVGVIAVTSIYLPFGLSRNQTGSEVTYYKFTDQELDPSTGLYNYDARLYDPVVGRFISADSIVPDWYNPQTLNRYSYVVNNPLAYRDPDGHANIEYGLDEKGNSYGGFGGLGIANPGSYGGKTDLNSQAHSWGKEGYADGQLREWAKDISFEYKASAAAAEALSAAGVFSKIAGWVGRKSSSLLRAPKSAAKAATEISESALKKGDKFFKGFAKRNPFGQTTKQIGEFTEFGVNVPGRVPGSYTRWVKVVNQEGRTVRLYHDTFDKTGKFINRGVKVPGPERHVP